MFLTRVIPVATVLLASIASTMSLYPHQLACFNEPLGGKQSGDSHLPDIKVGCRQSFLYSRKGLAYALPHRLVPLGTSAFYNASDLPMDCETVSDVPTQCPLSGTSTSPVVFTAHRLNGNGC